MMDREDLRSLATGTLIDTLYTPPSANTTAELAQGVLDLIAEREYREVVFEGLLSAQGVSMQEVDIWRTKYKTNKSQA